MADRIWWRWGDRMLMLKRTGRENEDTCSYGDGR